MEVTASLRQRPESGIFTFPQFSQKTLLEILDRKASRYLTLNCALYLRRGGLDASGTFDVIRGLILLKISHIERLRLNIYSGRFYLYVRKFKN